MNIRVQKNIRSIRVLKYSFSFCGFCVKQKFLLILRILRETNLIPFCVKQY